MREDAAEDAGQPHDSTGIRRLQRLQVLAQDSVGISGVLKVLSIMSQLSVEEIPAALALAKGAPREMREILFIGAIGRWAEFDPRAAAEGARSLKDREGNQAVEIALSEWAQQDAVAARAWIDGLPKGTRDCEPTTKCAASLSSKAVSSVLIQQSWNRTTSTFTDLPVLGSRIGSSSGAVRIN